MRISVVVYEEQKFGSMWLDKLLRDFGLTTPVELPCYETVYEQGVEYLVSVV
jgi:hypothetical protein